MAVVEHQKAVAEQRHAEDSWLKFRPDFAGRRRPSVALVNAAVGTAETSNAIHGHDRAARQCFAQLRQRQARPAATRQQQR